MKKVLYCLALLVIAFFLFTSCDTLVENSNKKVLEGYGTIKGTLTINETGNCGEINGPIYLVLIDNTSSETAPAPMGYKGQPSLSVIKPDSIFKKGSSAPYTVDFTIAKIPIRETPHVYELRAYLDNKANTKNVDFHPLLTLYNLDAPFDKAPFLNSLTDGDMSSKYFFIDENINSASTAIIMPSADENGKTTYTGTGEKHVSIVNINIQMSGQNCIENDRPFFKLDQDINYTILSETTTATLVFRNVDVRNLPKTIDGDTYDAAGLFDIEEKLIDLNEDGVNDTGNYPIVLLKKLKEDESGNLKRNSKTNEYIIDPANITLAGAVLTGDDVKDANGNLLKSSADVPAPSNRGFVAAVSMYQYEMFPSIKATTKLAEAGKYAIYLVNSNGTMWSIPNVLGDGYNDWSSLGQSTYYEVFE